MKNFCFVVIASAILILNSACNPHSNPTISNLDSLAKSVVKKPEHEVKENGLNIYYYDNGARKMEGLIQNEKREGLWRAWYINGTLWSEAHYTNGLNNGKSTVYFENGKVRYEGMYVDGKKVGVWKYNDEQGNLAKEVTN